MAEKKTPVSGIAEEILKKADQVLPGIGDFLRKAQKSKTFGPGLDTIRREIGRKFGDSRDQSSRKGKK